MGLRRSIRKPVGHPWSPAAGIAGNGIRSGNDVSNRNFNIRISGYLELCIIFISFVQRCTQCCILRIFQVRVVVLCPAIFKGLIKQAQLLVLFYFRRPPKVCGVCENRRHLLRKNIKFSHFFPLLRLCSQPRIMCPFLTRAFWVRIFLISFRLKR